MSICFVIKSFKLIYGAKFVENSAISLHAPGDLSRASLHESESWILAREDFRTADKVHDFVFSLQKSTVNGKGGN